MSHFKDKLQINNNINIDGQGSSQKKSTKAQGNLVLRVVDNVIIIHVIVDIFEYFLKKNVVPLISRRPTLEHALNLKHSHVEL